MKKIINSFRIAMGTYSILPGTQLERNKENSSCVLLFIPLIGALIGFVISKWAIGYPYLCSYTVLPAVVCAVIPSILSSGSHLDGFFRTVDAICSKKPREKKLQILEDSHGGYFAIIVCVCYFLLAIGIWSEMPIDGMFVLAYGYIISRSCYGLSILLLRHAKESKCSVYVPDGIGKWVQVIILLGYLVFCVLAMMSLDSRIASACLAGTAVSVLYYMFVSYKHFGGITEDSAGFFVQICEVVIPLAVLIAYKQWW